MNYLLGSGYYNSPGSNSEEFAAIWAKCLKRHAYPAPEKIIILSVGGESFPYSEFPSVDVISLPGNLGHVGALLSGEKPHTFCGWSAAFVTLAMLAYNSELDFIFLEQDCLAFGPWVKRIYADMGDGDMVFGDKMHSPPFMACGQSLVLVRHSFIPEMVAAYLGMGTDNDPHNLPETKFARLEEIFGQRVRRLSFGVDRERPIPVTHETFYAQKLTPSELESLTHLL